MDNILIYILIYTFNIYKQLRLYSNLYVKKQHISIAQWQFVFHLYFLNQTEFEKYKSGISFVSKITKEIFYSIFHNRIMNCELKSVLFMNLGFNI